MAPRPDQGARPTGLTLAKRKENEGPHAHLTSAHVAHSLADRTGLQALMMAHAELKFLSRADHGVDLQKHGRAAQAAAHAQPGCGGMAVQHGDGLINASSAIQRLLRLARTSMIARDAATTRHLNGSLDISRVWHGHVVRGTSSRVVDRVYESRDVRREW